MSNKAKTTTPKPDGKPALTPRLRFPEFREAEGWQSKQLGDLFSNRQEAGLSCLPLLSLMDKEGIVPQEESNRKNNSNSDKSKYLRVALGDIAYNTMRMCEGRSALVGLEGLVSPAYTVCAPKAKVHSPFFAYYFKTPQLIEQFRRYSQGLVKDTLNLKYEAFSQISVPTPLPPEQQKISECLSSVDELIAAQARKLDALKTHKKGLMQQLFPREGETKPRLRFPEFQNAGGWVEDQLGKLSVVLRGGSPRPIDGYLTNDPNGLNWLKIADVDKEAKYVTRTKEKVRPEALSKTRVVNPGDLILSNSMSFGRPYILKIKTCIHDGWIALTKIDQQIDRDFLYYAISAPSSQSYFITNAAGSGVQNLNAEIIKSLRVCLPDHPEQKRIADFLTSLDDLIAAQTQMLDALRTHKKGLMQQLFPSPEELVA